MMSTESVYNLLQDLCRHHLKAAGEKSGKVKSHIKKLQLLCYKVLLTNVRHDKEEGAMLSSYEKLLSHAADLNIKGFNWQAQRLDSLTLKLLNNQGTNVSETFNVFSLLVSLFNTGIHKNEELSCKDLQSRRNYLNGTSDHSYSQYDESDFNIIPNDRFQYELDYNNNNKENKISESIVPSNAFSSFENSSIMWELASKLITKKRYSWEELGRCDILIERPFITELPTTKIAPQQIQFTPSLASDVVKLLVGVPSQLFQWNEDRFHFVASKKNGSLILANVCKEFLEVGCCVKKLMKFSGEFSKCLASVHGAFGKAIESFLLLYCFSVTSITRNCKSFAQIKFTYRKIFKQLRYLKQFCETLILCEDGGSSFVDASDLLAKLYEKCVMVEDDVDLQPLSIFLFKSACCPYFKMLQDWVYLGAIPDDDNQFMITPDFCLGTCKDENFWKKGFELKNVPCFLKDIAEVILTCGKSINLLKLCCDQHYLTNNHPDTSQLRPPIVFAMTNSSLKLYQNSCKIYFDKVIINRSKASRFHPAESSIGCHGKKSENDTALPPKDDKLHSSCSGSETNSRSSLNVSSENSSTTDEEHLQNAHIQSSDWDSDSDEHFDLFPKLQNESHDTPNLDVPSVENSHVAPQSHIMEEDNSEALHLKQSEQQKSASMPADYIPRRKVVQGKHVGMESNIFKVFSRENSSNNSVSSSCHEVSGNIVKCNQNQVPDGVYSSKSGCHSNKFVQSFEEIPSCDEPTASQGAAYDTSQIKSDYEHVSLKSRNPLSASFDFDCLDANIFSPKIDKMPNEADTHVKDDILFSVWVRESLFYSIKIQAFLVDQALLDYFVHTVKIHQYFDAFQKYILLQDGHFAASLVEQLSNRFYSAKSTSFGALRSSIMHEVLNPAYLNSLLQQILSTCSGSRGKSSFEVSSRLTFVIPRNDRESSEVNEADPLSLLRLTATLDWPACIVIQKKHMQAYHSLFTFLFKIKRVMWSLNEIYINLKRDASIFTGGKRFHEQYQVLHIFRHNMQHFAQVIQDYINNQVMAVSWQEFQYQLDPSLQGKSHWSQVLGPVKNLDSLISSHSEFVEKCTSRCLLNKNSSSVLSCINSIFHLIFLFHDQLNSEPWMRMEVDGRVEVFHPKFEILVKTHSKFQQACTFLLRVLCKLEEKWQRPHIQELLLRLNFNYSLF